MTIEFKDVTHSYKKNSFATNISCRINNSITCVIGPNGAGKTTFIKILAGMISKYRGNLFINDILRTEKDQIDFYKQSYFLIDDPVFYPKLTGSEMLKVLGLYRDINNFDRIVHVLKNVGLESHKKIKHYSKGMKMRLIIASIMLFEPELIVLDEPMNGLDSDGIFLLKDVLQSFHKAGKTIIITSHLLNEMEDFCTNYIMMKDGRVISEGFIDNKTDSLKNIYININQRN